MAVMSNEFPIDPLDENIISELVNQLFKAPPVPLPAETSIGAVPQSVAGSGVSPSAINQGNSVDLKDPQTSLPDPHFAGKGLVPSSVAGSGASPSAASYKGPRQNEPATMGSMPRPATFSAEPAFYFADPANPFAHFRQPQPTQGALAAPPFDVNQVRRDFPILHQHVNGHPLVWLDNAATTQKPELVIQRISQFYRHENSNIHRAAHELAARSTDAYEGARGKVQHFLNAASPNEIVFVRGATEAINLVAKSWGQQFLQPGDEIIVSHLEHHANIVPWQQLAAANNLKLKVIPVDDDGQVLLEEYGRLLSNKTKLVSFTQVSNALGTITPAKKIVEMAHAVGAKALVDGAQAVSHMPVDVRHLDADWYVFSGHKVFGPTGIGVLYGKEDLLNGTNPWQGGGNMIKDVTFEHTSYQPAPAKFEAGTGNIADAVGLGAAIDYVSAIGMQNISLYEHYLLQYATRLLKEVPGLHLIGTAPDKAGVLSFVLDGYKTEEVGSALNARGIAVRSGHHCAQPILRRFGQESTVRPSLALYNTCGDIDALVGALHRLPIRR
jgi:cysteine desulfurase/selenocysteine lyase